MTDTTPLHTNRAEADALYKLGAAHSADGRNAEAVEAYRAAVAKDPDHVFSVHDLGMALHFIGQNEEAVACLKEMRTLSPAHYAIIAANLINVLHWGQPIADWPRLYADAFAGEVLSPINRYLVLIYRALSYWVAYDAKALQATLEEAAIIRPERNALTEAFLLYELFLNKLAAYRMANPGLYADTGKKLFMVGDSHVLSYAGIKVTVDAADYTVASQLIIGAKAWHISAPKQNQYTAEMDAHILRMPESAWLACSFGEIDTRMNEGILPYQKKSHRDLSVIVEEQVTRYVASVTARAKPKSLKLLFLSLPAPHPDRGDRREVTALFNAALARHVAAAGHRYIDLYKITVGSDGYARGELHIDPSHLKAEALLAALKA